MIIELTVHLDIRKANEVPSENTIHDALEDHLSDLGLELAGVEIKGEEDSGRRISR